MIRTQFHFNCCISQNAPSSSSKSCRRYDQNPIGTARIVLRSSLKSQTPITLSSKNRCSKPSLRLCKASLGPRNGDDKEVDGDDGFLQASLMVSETVRHYSLWKQGFVENTKWQSPGREHLYSHRKQDNRFNASSIGHGILRRFQSPTIFLKIACDGDLLLPIVVGEFAIIQLIDALSDEQNEASFKSSFITSYCILNVSLLKEIPDQFQFARSVVVKFGYEVKMVRITERVVNTYHARIHLGKPTNDFSISIDARPSDAINVAERFQAPIYVSKEIVRKDAIKIVYGKWKGSGKTVYDVSLDSAVEGHDPLAEEISMIWKMNIAALEERYEDAAMWRDKLDKLRMPSK